MDFTEAGQGDKHPRGPGEVGWGSASRGWTVGPVLKEPNRLAQLLTREEDGCGGKAGDTQKAAVQPESRALVPLKRHR